MRLDAVTAEIRPRSDWEAVDLGLAMVRRDFWRCFAVWWLAVLIPTALAGWWLWDYPVLWLLLFWWCKPFGSRMVLFELSRRLFGEKPSWLASLRQIPKAWTHRFFYRMLWARFSPWLPVTLAVEDLEGLRGKAYKQRCSQVTRRGDGAIMWIYFMVDAASCWFGLGLLTLVLLFIPEGQDGSLLMEYESWNVADLESIPLLILRMVACCVMFAMSLTDLFVSGAGFGVYLNNRTWVEGWDVELALKRLARRLTKTALLWMMLVSLVMPAVSHAAAESDPEGYIQESQETIREVKEDPAFIVHTVIDREPQPWNLNWDWLERLFRGLSFGGGVGGGEFLGNLFWISGAGIVLGLLVWLIWKNRHAFMISGGGGGVAPESQSARVVMGMQVSPESLPDDVPAAAWHLWNLGRRQEALGLLYRGAISRVIEIGRVEIQESDTEGDCVRRVAEKGPEAHPDYFRGITGAWTRMAYAGLSPEDAEIESLCRSWPFADRRHA
jgi:hypothetical protein